MKKTIPHNNLRLKSRSFVALVLASLFPSASQACVTNMLSSYSATILSQPTDNHIGVSNSAALNPWFGPAPCTLSAMTDVPWISIGLLNPPSFSNFGNGSIEYKTPGNPGATRIGHITAGPIVYTVTQPGGYGNASISANVFGSPLTISTSADMAAAISSLTWNGMQFLVSSTHGQGMQSSMQLDGLGECYNPTEGGSLNDGGTSELSTSQLYSFSPNSTFLGSVSKMAFWLNPGETDPNINGCNGMFYNIAKNSTTLSSNVINKYVAIGYAGLPNVIEYMTTFGISPMTIANTNPPLTTTGAGSSAVFESIGAYMPEAFNTFYTFDPSRNILSPLPTRVLPAGAAGGEQSLPLIMSTGNHAYALGVYSPTLPQTTYPTVGYGRYDFGTAVKWAAVYRSNPNGPVPQSNSFTNFLIIGTLQEVTQSMTALYKTFH